MDLLNLDLVNGRGGGSRVFRLGLGLITCFFGWRDEFESGLEKRISSGLGERFESGLGERFRRSGNTHVKCLIGFVSSGFYVVSMLIRIFCFIPFLCTLLGYISV